MPGRRLFAAYDLAELTVEELALRHYLSDSFGNRPEDEGFHYGIHCEGALLRDLFGLLLYDELFDTSIEGVFASVHQDAPLDLGTEAFYLSRQSKLEQRLGGLASLSAEALSQEVQARFATLYGTCIRGVRWDRYQGACSSFCVGGEQDNDGKSAPSRRMLWIRGGEESAPQAGTLAAAAGAVGGRALAAAFRLLCQEHNSAGLPDLLVWSCGEGLRPRARFVEVKSERDKISRRQLLWLATLRSAGSEAEVCHIRDHLPAARKRRKE